MNRILFAPIICILICLIAACAVADPSYIYGMHDFGGERDMASMHTKGWIVDSAAIGHNPSDKGGFDYSKYTKLGYGVIARLNNGYGPDGTLPYQSEYQSFAQRCANYVSASPGCHIWIIGNEINLPREWPGNTGPDNTGEPITVARYADCYKRCYTAIKSLPGHGKDQIIPSPVGTWAPPFPEQGIEGFNEYWVKELKAVSGKVDGIAVHAYTHGSDPKLVFSEKLMNPPYQDIHFNFRVYKDILAMVPASMKKLPAYITECDQCDTWVDTNSGWVSNIYSEINSWNRTPGTQKIRCVALFRWVHAGEGDAFYICDRKNLRADWRNAMKHKYTWD